MGNVFHQRFNLIVTEELLNKVAEHLGKNPKDVTEKEINETIYEIVLNRE